MVLPSLARSVLARVLGPAVVSHAQVRSEQGMRENHDRTPAPAPADALVSG